MRTRQVIEQLLQKFKVTICVVAEASAAMFRDVKCFTPVLGERQEICEGIVHGTEHRKEKNTHRAFF